MINKKRQELLNRDDYLHVEEVEAAFPKLRLLRTSGEYEDEQLNIQLYYDPDTNKFFEKAPVFRGHVSGFCVLNLSLEDDWKPWVDGTYEVEAYKKITVHQKK